MSKGVRCNVAVIEESNSIESFYCSGLTDDAEQNRTGEYLVELYKDAKETGSMLRPEILDIEGFSRYIEEIEQRDDQIDFDGVPWLENTLPLVKKLAAQHEILTGRYSVVCTNPPYMNKYDANLKKFVKDNYKEYSSDLFSIFIYRNFDFCVENGYSALMTPNVWMFIKSYEQLRRYIVENKSIITLIQMAKGAFFKEATVDICTFVLKNSKVEEKGLYIRLEDFKGDMEVQKEKVLEALENKNCGYFYESDEKNFIKIPGMPIAYWVSDKCIKTFEVGNLLGSISSPKTGMTTGDNNRFLRMWYEVDVNKSKFDANSSVDAKASLKKWFSYCKGGGYMKWYGYNEYVINWENDGYEIKNNIKENGMKAASVRSEALYFKQFITWSAVTSGKFSCRISQKGALFDSGGSSIKVDNQIYYIMALLNSTIGQFYLDINNATINYQPGDIANIPVITMNEDSISVLVNDCINNAKYDWDAFETSWDFKRHPLI